MLHRSLVPLFLFVLLAPFIADARTNLPIPRFVTIKASEANARTGPSIRYPIRWVYERRGLPVEIIAEFEHWRKIQDVNGDGGWVHESLLSGVRNVIIKGKTTQDIHRAADKQSYTVFRAEPGVIAALEHCENGWCQVALDNQEGWIEQGKLWGVYK